MKRGQIIGIFIFTSLLISASLVAAQSFQSFDESFSAFLDNIVQSASFHQLLEIIVGQTDDAGVLFVKFLLFILLITIVYYAAEKVPNLGDNKPFLWIVSIVISLIAIRFLASEQLVEFVWLPNGVLGMALLTFLPFVIYFFFIEHQGSSIIRKVGWIVFGVIFLGLTFYRWGALSTGSGWWQNLAWMYFIIFILSILAIAFDKTIRAKIIFSAIEKKGSDLDQMHIAQLQQNIQQWKGIIANPASTPQQITAAKNNIKNAQKNIKVILKS